jgi:hypothetical protein
MQYTERSMDMKVTGFLWMVVVVVNDLIETILGLQFDDLGHLDSFRALQANSSSSQGSIS